MSSTATTRMLMFAFVAAACAAQAATIHVATTGNDADDGLTWATAKRTVQAGLNAAQSADQVWVAAGTYVQCITLRDGVALYGGFAGGESDLSQRNGTVNETVLDGGKAGSVVTVPAGASGATRIDGFTIRNGTGTLMAADILCGGGIFCGSGSSSTIINNTITGNNVNFSGIHCLYSSVTISNNTIRGNYLSGGIYGDYSSLLINNNMIVDNSYCGVSLGEQCTAMVAHNTIMRNTSGIECYSSSPTIISNTIVGNSTGIRCHSLPATIVNTIIAFNSFLGIQVDDGMVIPSHNCVYGNGCDYWGTPDPTGTGGNISLDPQLADFSNGNIHIQPSSPCADAGDDTVVQSEWTDLDGQPRIQGAHVDIGADESDGTVWPAPPAIIYVKPSGDDSNNGLSWATAKRTVQAGIKVGGAGTQVWVAAGTYVENTVLGFGISLYGGFSGTETQLSQRDWIANVTILDGNGVGTVVTGPLGTPTMRVDGFTIRNGNGGIELSLGTISNNTITNNSDYGVACGMSSTVTSNTIAGNSGDGIYCSDFSTISNNTISGNSGVVIRCCGSATITNNTIIDGSTSGDGRGVYCTYTTCPTIRSNTIISNSGDAIYCEGNSNPTITDNVITGTRNGIVCSYASATISRNTISGSVTGMAGILCSFSSPTIVGNTIVDNTGGIYCYYSSATITDNTIRGNYLSGGIYCTASSYPTITGNIITGNNANHGGGICCDCSTPTITGNTISGNSATGTYGSGGGIYCCGSSPIVAHNAIRDNEADLGGAISVTGSDLIADNNTLTGNKARYGGGIYCEFSVFIISSSTLTSNFATADGGGISCYRSLYSKISDTIIAMNSSGLFSAEGAPAVRHCCVYGNTMGNYSNMADATGTSGNISIDPLFVRAPSCGPDATWGTADDDYGDLHLQPGSPCIDAGDPAHAPAPGETDMDAQPRVINACVDIGADEWTLAGDGNGDGSVDVVDLLMLVDAWGSTAGDAAYDLACDFNHDGLVDVVDLLILVEHWGQSNQPTVSLSVSGSPMADVAGATATVTATLSGPASVDLTVGLTFGGTATKDTDYTASATQIVIPAGQTSGSPITLTLVGDNSYNPARTITLTGQPVSGASYAGSNQVAVDLSATTAAQYKAKGETWLAQNATQPGVVTLPSGLQYKVINPGAGLKPDANDRVFVAYAGNLIDGTVFDSNAGIAFGVNEVIAGLAEGLQLMPLNAKYILYFPSILAYGEAGNSSIPPNAALVFEIELKGIQQIP